MKRTNEVDYKDLKMVCNPEQFDFETTEELDPIDTGIGQDRGIRALEFGLNVDVRGYNLYMEGPSGVGKTMYAKIILTLFQKRKKFLKIGAIYITLTTQMNQLQFHSLLVVAKNFKI